jgi:hypothetical protein
MNEIKINAPEGFEIDIKNSTLEVIKFKTILKLDKLKEKEMQDFLFSVFNNSTLKITGEKITTFYNENNEWLFKLDYKYNYFLIIHSLIWKIFEDKYGLNYNQIRDFIGAWVKINLGWEELRPWCNF